MNQAPTKSFTLPPDREAAFWRLVEAVGVAPLASVATLVRETLERGRGLPGHDQGFGAAAELAFRRKRGETVELLQRPPVGVP